MFINHNLLLCTTVLVSLAGCTGTSGQRYASLPSGIAETPTDNTSLHHCENLMYNEAFQELKSDHPPCTPYIAVATAPDKSQQTVHRVTEKPLGLMPPPYTVHFDFGKSAIRTDEQKELDRIAKTIKKKNAKKVSIFGYADTHGTESLNMALSEQRTQAISNALQERGISETIIDTKFYGETRLAIDTENGVKSQTNRRAVIKLDR